MSTLDVRPSPTIGGEAVVPGDKSVTHRALMLGAIATGTTEIVHPGGGEDNHATMGALTALGVEFIRPDAEHITVRGVGLRGLRSAAQPLNCENSGTTTRLLAGLLAGAGVKATLIGDDSLSGRPMRRVAEPLRELGYIVETSEKGTLPLEISGTRSGGDESVRVILRTASAQVKSCILLSGLYRSGVTEVVEPSPSRDHSERLLRAFGVRVESSAHYLNPDAGSSSDMAPWCRLHPTSGFRGRLVEVPGDISSASFLLAAGLLVGSGVKVRDVGVNPTRTGFLKAIARMGARVELSRRRQLSSNEPVADIRVVPGPLSATRIAGDEIPALIDEIPILCVLGAASTGRFEVRDAKELRVKESDRIAHTAALLTSLGCVVETFDDGLAFDGLGGPVWAGFESDSAGDHRIAMCAATAAYAASSPSRIHGAGAVAVSYPTYVDTMLGLGALIDDGVKRPAFGRGL
jgi:3-phosphoshikimate 1-carboxyvinyltransferase